MILIWILELERRISLRTVGCRAVNILKLRWALADTSLAFIIVHVNDLTSELTWTSFYVEAQLPLFKLVFYFDVAAVLKIEWRVSIKQLQVVFINKINLKDFWLAIDFVELLVVIDDAFEHLSRHIIEKNLQKCLFIRFVIVK